MNPTPPDWRPDPYGRAEQRYWDGSEWTARIRNRGEETVDPLGNSPVIPFTLPTGIVPARRRHRLKIIVAGILLTIAAVVVVIVLV